MDLRVAAYAVVTDDDGRLLLARWTEGRRVAWTMPGGGLEAHFTGRSLRRKWTKATRSSFRSRVAAGSAGAPAPGA